MNNTTAIIIQALRNQFEQECLPLVQRDSDMMAYFFEHRGSLDDFISFVPTRVGK